MAGFYINLDKDARRALSELAKKEYRDFHAQACILVIEGLKQRGFLQESTEKSAQIPADFAQTEVPQI